MVVGIMAVVAQAERKMISARTKAALAAAKARGVQLGRPENLRNQDQGRERGRARRTALAGERAVDLRPIIMDVQASGASSLRGIASGLNERGIPTARGGAWSAVQVKRVMRRAGLKSLAAAGPAPSSQMGGAYALAPRSRTPQLEQPGRAKHNLGGKGIQEFNHA